MNTHQQQSSYRQIVKATSLFGGVKIIQIIIQIIKSKFIAVLLGPAGMGIYGLLNSAINLVGELTGFGLGTSAVKNVASANGSNNQTRVAIIVTVLRRWVWITGLLGLIVTAITAPWLSRLTFGNSDYTWAFIWISVALLFRQLSSGQLVILQGLRKLKLLAKSNLTGSILGLLITVPMYYRWGLKGIVPSIIATAIVTLLSSWYFSNKVKTQKIKVSKIRTIAEGKDMLRMGFAISMSALITLAASYIVRIYITHTSGIEDVGLYNAGFAIIGTYVGMIFSAMATDFYPRLSAIASNIKEASKVICQQGEIALLIITPVLVVFIIFIHWIILLLYSGKFTPVNEMIVWAATGMIFKAASWSIAFLFLAKGSSRLFFINELIATAYLLALNIAGYYLYGLTGLGMSFLIAYFIYMLQVYFVTKIIYKLQIMKSSLFILLVQSFFILAAFIIAYCIKKPSQYMYGTLLFSIVSAYSIFQLNKRINLRTFIFNNKQKQ